MGKRKVTILEPVVEAVSKIAFFTESKGLPQTAKRFVDKAFEFFESLSDERVVHRPCKQIYWKRLNLRCTTYHKKYIVAYLNNSDEIIICDFMPQKLLK